MNSNPFKMGLVASLILVVLGFQNCAKIKVSSAPAEVADVASLAAVDKTCALGTNIAVPFEDLELHCKNDDPESNNNYFQNGMANYIFPKHSQLPQTVPASCLRGIEVNNMEQQSISFLSLSPTGTSKAISLEVDFATYVAPDGSRLIAKNVDGTESVIFDSCHMRTACYGDPTGGTKRPYEDSIRSFRVDLPVGTVSLTLDQSDSKTPTYIRILGLCEFDLSDLPANKSSSSSGRITRFAVVTDRAVSPMGLVSPSSANNEY